jgi:T5SS/PEP-CTERM-associated repeat protein
VLQLNVRLGRSLYIVCGVSLLIGVLFGGQTFGAINTTGNVTPDPTTTTSGDNIYVGDTTDGTMTVDSARDVDSVFSFIGDDVGATGTATVTGAGSTWTNSVYLHVGRWGTGTLNIENGGVVTDVFGYLGNRAGSTGTATVTGVGSTWTNSGNLYVGRSGNGTLNIENGAVVNTGLDTRIRIASSGSGIINFNGGTLNTDGLLAAPSDLLGTGIINTTGVVSDIDLVFDQNHAMQQQFVFNSEPGQSITITGTGSTWTNSGYLVVADAGTGTLNIQDGGAVTVGDELLIHIASTLGISLSSVSDPFLDVTGNAWLTGTLELLLAGGFMPAYVEVFQIMTFAARNDTQFATIIGPQHYW